MIYISSKDWRTHMAETNDMAMLSQEEIDKLIKKMEEEKNS